MESTPEVRRDKEGGWVWKIRSGFPGWNGPKCKQPFRTSGLRLYLRLDKAAMLVDLSYMKSESRDQVKKLQIDQAPRCELVPAGPWLLEEIDTLNLLWTWRLLNSGSFFFDQKPSLDSFSRYLAEGPVEASNRLLFLICERRQILGHIGLVVKQDNSAELDNVIRGVSDQKHPKHSGLMSHSIRSMMQWANSSLGINEFELQVRSDNPRAIALYQRCGFLEVSRGEVGRTSISNQTPISAPEIDTDNSPLERVVMTAGFIKPN